MKRRIAASQERRALNDDEWLEREPERCHATWLQLPVLRASPRRVRRSLRLPIRCCPPGRWLPLTGQATIWSLTRDLGSARRRAEGSNPVAATRASRLFGHDPVRRGFGRFSSTTRCPTPSGSSGPCSSSMGRFTKLRTTQGRSPIRRPDLQRLGSTRDHTVHAWFQVERLKASSPRKGYHWK